MNIWMLRFLKATEAFQELKSMTKRVPATTWTPEYSELASKIHSHGRDYFHAGMMKDMIASGLIPVSDEMQKVLDDPKLFDPQIDPEAQTPLEKAYSTLSKLLAQFPNCLLCGRGMPGHHAPDCEKLLIYDDVRRERGEIQ